MSDTTRPEASEYAPFYAGYISRVPAGPLIQMLEDNGRRTAALFRSLPLERAEQPTAPGKWTPRQVLGHMADTERVFAFRLLWVARGDTTPLPGFEQDGWVQERDLSGVSLEGQVQDHEAVRSSTLHLLRGLGAADWTRLGTASGSSVSVRALACMIAGHELHHHEILAARGFAVKRAGL